MNNPKILCIKCRKHYKQGEMLKENVCVWCFTIEQRAKFTREKNAQNLMHDFLEKKG